MESDLRGYTKVFVYVSINDPKVIYVSKTDHSFKRFFANRYNGDSSEFKYNGEMMVKLRKFYVQVYHGVYRRIYTKEKVNSKPVKLKKEWVNDNLKGTNMRKLKEVIVGWKHSEQIKTDTGVSFHYKFPKISYEGDDLNGRTQWSDIKWLRQAVIDYIEHTGYDPKKIDDTFVNRISI